MMRPVASVLLCVLAGCSDQPPTLDALAGHDVRCLQHQVFDLSAPFHDATLACGAAKPDLTGNIRLQAAALAAQVPFTIRPHADAYLKQQQAQLVVGTLIPEPGVEDHLTPANGVFTSTMPLFDGH